MFDCVWPSRTAVSFSDNTNVRADSVSALGMPSHLLELSIYEMLDLPPTSALLILTAGAQYADHARMEAWV
jgi:hypothetical protein